MNRRWGIGTGLFLVALFALHQDFWNWHSAERVLGLPAGFAYHVAYCLVASAVLAFLTRGMSAQDRGDQNRVARTRGAQDASAQHRDASRL